jgi:hypothetical protein
VDILKMKTLKQKRAYQKEWRKKNPGYVKRHNVRYYAENKEDILAYSKEYRKENIAKCQELQQRWRKNNVERVRFLAQRWRDKNREALTIYNRLYKREWRLKKAEI